MKTTLDLPDALVKQVKLRALHEGRKLKEAVADLLRKGLAVATDVEDHMPLEMVAKDKKTGLPLIPCKKAPTADMALTPERVADILFSQDAGWHHVGG